MNKQDKKFEKTLIKALTQCCESFKNDINGFLWLTHTLSFSNITQSIKIICVFEDNNHLNKATENNELITITNDIVHCLKGLGINLKYPTKHIKFDSEENCKLSHEGDWQKRLNQKHH